MLLLLPPAAAAAAAAAAADTPSAFREAFQPQHAAAACFGLEVALRMQRVGAEGGDEIAFHMSTVTTSQKVSDVFCQDATLSRVHFDLSSLLQLASLAASSMADATSAAAADEVDSQHNEQQQQQRQLSTSIEQVTIAITCLMLGELAIKRPEPVGAARAASLAVAQSASALQQLATCVVLRP
jgi:hypothetical protein